MDFAESPETAALRAQLRDLMRELLPPDFLGAFTDDPSDLATTQRFCRELGARGLISLSWPAQYGGQERSVWELMALREEMWARHEPRGPQYMNVNWVAPGIMRFGTEAQKEQHLPAIAAGDELWCQGFSEPEAGSDLASLRTVAKPVGDGWEVHGQKVWTSYATMAQWIFLLARTDPAAEKHQGITAFLVPMDRSGIEVRPIRAMIGPHHLNEVFFDGVWVGPDDVLGEVNGGWRLVRETLAFERVGIARYARCERLLLEAPLSLGERWQGLPDVLKGRWAMALVHARQARLLAYRVVDRQASGQVDPSDAAVYRIAVTKLDQEVGEVLMDVVEEFAVGGGEEPYKQFVRAVEDHWRYAQASTVASGSTEMQRVLLSRAMVGEGR
ncbi:MAG TPA: acyl-CoA dehydrogenase family protein [Acidimicrobiales bacterium]